MGSSLYVGNNQERHNAGSSRGELDVDRQEDWMALNNWGRGRRDEP